MTNPYYAPAGVPANRAAFLSAPVRSEFGSIEDGFDKLPALTAGTAVIVNAGGTALTNTVGSLALAGNFATTGTFNTTLAQTASTTLTLPAVSGTLVITTPRVGAVTDAATITPPSATVDQYNVTALAQAATIAAPSGSPSSGQKLILRIKDNGTARALTWTTSSGGYRVVGTTLPTTTVLSKTTYVGCIWNNEAGYWDVLAVQTET